MWNYRIIKQTVNKEVTYGLHEVIYNDDGKLSCYTENPEVTAESVEELEKTLYLMFSDCLRYSATKSIIDADNVKFHPLVDDDKGDYIEITNIDDLFKDAED